MSQSSSDSSKKKLKNTVLETKRLNKKLRRRKKKVSEKEFNDVKNMTGALEDVLNQLKNDNK